MCVSVCVCVFGRGGGGGGGDRVTLAYRSGIEGGDDVALPK